MRPLYTLPLRYFLIFLISLQFSTSFAQNEAPPLIHKSIEQLERDVLEKKILQQTQQEFEAIKKEALQSHNDILYARALYNLMKIKDQRTEDTLYFRNSAFIDTLLKANTTPKLKAILYVMRAKRISAFENMYKRFNAATYRTKDLTGNYAALTPFQRDSLVMADLMAAMQYHDPTFDGKQLAWISSNPTIFLFEPKFEDIVLSERINLLAIERSYNAEQRVRSEEWLSLSSIDFRYKLQLLSKDTASSSALKAYQQWLAFNEASPATSSFIESLVRKYIYLSAQSDSLTKQDYTAYLQESTTSPYPALKAHAIYQLCLIYNEEGNQYLGSGVPYLSYIPQSLNPKNQFSLIKALKLYLDNRAWMVNYPIFNRVLELMVKQIQSKGIWVEMEDHYLPNEAIPLLVTYKNINALNYRIIKISSTEPSLKDTVLATNSLLSRAVAAQGSFSLPLPLDHNKHAIYLKLEPLPIGRYRLLFSNMPLEIGTKLNNIVFNVTNIAAVNSDEKIAVLDRRTGFPLAGAKIKMFKDNRSVGKGIPIIVDKDGFVQTKEADNIHIVYKGDTLNYNFNAIKNALSDEVYSKEEYDDLLEFHEDHVRMEIFTDRSIYRPGQTVHYKIIFLTNDPKTGKAILFNRQNLGDGIFKNRLKKWLADDNDKIWLQDPFRKTIDSTRFTLNDFGSFAGSFTVPKTAATGEWSIEGEAETDYRGNRGNFKVEEYKRPTIELAIEKQKKMLKPGQSFDVKFRLRSLSGADLGNIPINYTITRRGHFSELKNGASEYVDDYKQTELLHKTGYTNNKGELLVTVSDSTAAKAIPKGDAVWNFNYSINATATDATGESTEIDESLAVSTQPIKIRIPLNKVYDRQNFPVLNVSTEAYYEGTVGKIVNIKLYKVTDPELKDYHINRIDQWYYNQSEWNAWFPTRAEGVKPKDERILILDTLINTATFEKLRLNKERIKEGFYQLLAECRDDGRLIGKTTANFSVFDSKETGIPINDVDYLEFNSVKPGAWITWYSSSKKDKYAIYQILYVGGKNKKGIRNSYQTKVEKAGINLWKYLVPTDATDEIMINKISVSNNTIEKLEKRIFIEAASKSQPEITVEKYRRVMAPGTQETFSLSVKTKNDNIAAELLTTLYDASLDKLEPHKWQLPTPSRSPNLYTRWNYALTFPTAAGNYREGQFSIYSDFNQVKSDTVTFTALSGKVAGLSINDARGLQEVVVVGYGTSIQRSLSSSRVVLRGNRSLLDFGQPLVILDGKIFSDDLKKLDATSIIEAMVLKGADATALYGSDAANGVLIISTKGPIVLPDTEPTVVKIRKNFNETAFFFPQVHARADGFYTFSFTMPETATDWNWKMLAHTRKASFAYLEKKLQTQLSLMVQPNMPRLLYQGDAITLQSRITNLDTLAIKGTATCRIEDAVTGEELTAVIATTKSMPFKLDPKSSGAVSFVLRIPSQQTNPLKIVISAATASTGDAEEHIIPVLSTRIFTRQNKPIHFTDQSTVIVPSVKLPSDALLYGVGISIDQKPAASLVYALPWLANYSYDCAEQTFNKLRAKVTALRLIQKDTTVQKAFKEAAAVVAKQNLPTEQLPDELADETMPWLGISSHAARQQNQLFHLLDTVSTKKGVENHLDKLYQLQQSDGGLTWFEGGKSNPYISAYVLAGFGQLKQTGWVPEPKRARKHNEFIGNLFNYHESLLAKSSEIESSDLFQLYALSYWCKTYSLTEQMAQKVNSVLNKAWAKADEKNLSQQALLIITTFRFTTIADPLNQKAQTQLENIKQLAIYDELNGFRWKEISDTEELNNSEEETMALLAEAFELSGKYPTVQTGIVKWLLTARQDDHWQTTKATAAAIDLLQKNKEKIFDGNKALSAQVNDQKISISDDLLTGVPTSMVKTDQLPQSITIKQDGTNANGNLTWYYFAQPSQLNTLNKGITINRQFFSYNEGRGWGLLNAETPLKTGDRVRVKLSIETDSRLKFVHINDPRAAAFEPKENNSGYRYTDGFGYYLSIRDTGLDIFAEAIPKGISEITYELIVAHTGEFTSGPARLQCMYQPAKTAYSDAMKINTKAVQ